MTEGSKPDLSGFNGPENSGAHAFVDFVQRRDSDLGLSGQTVHIDTENLFRITSDEGGVSRVYYGFGDRDDFEEIARINFERGGNLLAPSTISRVGEKQKMVVFFYNSEVADLFGYDIGFDFPFGWHQLRTSYKRGRLVEISYGSYGGLISMDSSHYRFTFYPDQIEHAVARGSTQDLEIVFDYTADSEEASIDAITVDKTQKLGNDKVKFRIPRHIDTELVRRTLINPGLLLNPQSPDAIHDRSWREADLRKLFGIEEILPEGFEGLFGRYY